MPMHHPRVIAFRADIEQTLTEADLAIGRKQTVSDRNISSRDDALALPVIRIVELLYAHRTAFQDWNSFPRQGLDKPAFWH